MRAPEIYQRIVGVMTMLGFTRWNATLSFRDVPEGEADNLFQVLPVGADPQVSFVGSYFIDTGRKWRISVLFRVLGSVPEVLQDRVLIAEESITDALLALEEGESVSSTYSDTDDAGGIIRLAIDFATRCDRQI